MRTGSPATQKTYKVKSEGKVTTTPATMRPENPFIKSKQVVVSPVDVSPPSSTDFRPFDAALI